VSFHYFLSSFCALVVVFVVLGRHKVSFLVVYALVIEKYLNDDS
jgi:hypothetical protein